MLVLSLFFTILRSVAIPYVSYMFLKNTALGDEGALLAVGIALTISNVMAIIWNLIKIVPNTILLRGHAIIGIFLKIAIQVLSAGYLWYYYAKNFTDYLN